MEKNPNWTSGTAPKGKGRGFTRYQFTVMDIAKITEKHPQTVRNDISKKRLDMTDLKSICKYIKEKESKPGDRKE